MLFPIILFSSLFLLVNSCIGMIPHDTHKKMLFDAIIAKKPLLIKQTLHAAPQLINEGGQVLGCCGEEVMPLHAAAAYGHTDCVKILLEHGADPNERSDVCAHSLFYARNVKTAKLLIQYGVEVDHKRYYHEKWHTPFFYALIPGQGLLEPPLVHNRSLAVAAVLLKAGAHINTTDEEKNNYLHKTVALGDYEAVEFLLRNDIKKNKQNRHGQTPLTLAVKQNNSRLVQLLLSYDVQVFPSFALYGTSRKNISDDSWKHDPIQKMLYDAQKLQYKQRVRAMIMESEIAGSARYNCGETICIFGCMPVILCGISLWLL